MNRERLPGLGLVYAVLLTLLLLMPADAEWHAHRENRWLSANLGLSPPAAVRDFVLNVGIFMPIGFVLGRRREDERGLRAESFVVTVVTAAAYSLAVESAQYWLAWRASSFFDVVANTLGAGLGAGSIGFARWGTRHRPTRHDPLLRRQAVRTSAPSKTGLSVRSISDSSPSVGSCSA